MNGVNIGQNLTFSNVPQPDGILLIDWTETDSGGIAFDDILVYGDVPSVVANPQTGEKFSLVEYLKNLFN